MTAGNNVLPAPNPERQEDMSTITSATDHTIETIEPLPTDRPKGGASWHQVTCSCGWIRKYVSRYRAIVMHGKHTREA